MLLLLNIYMNTHTHIHTHTRTHTHTHTHTQSHTYTQVRRYGKLPALYLHDGKPLFYVYDSYRTGSVRPSATSV